MSHVEVLREIESRGLRLTAAGGDLKLQGPRDRMDPGLIGLVRAHKAELVAHLTAAEPAGFPLLPLQRAYLLGRTDAFEFGNVANHIYREIEGVWDLDRLQAALDSVVRRHPMLRTRFTEDGRQVEDPSAALRIGRVDLRQSPSPERDRRRLELREERSHRILPADRAPLVAVDVTILAEDRMVLHLSHDGLAMDGISEFLFGRDWWACYGTGAQLPPLAPQASFEACVAALTGARSKAPAERSRGYWLARLDDLAPPPDLPLRTNPATIDRPRFSPRAARLDRAAWAALKDRAVLAGLTPSVVLMAAYADALSAWGGGPRFTLNTTIAGRPPVHPDVYRTVGPFVDTLLVEVAADRSVPFGERAAELQAQLRRDIDHRHFSGVDVLRELGRRRGLSAARMPYTFNSAIGYVLGDVDGTTFDGFGEEVYVVSQTPQVWLNAFAREVRDGVVVEIDGVDELFPDGLLDGLVEGYQRLLGALSAGDGWSGAGVDLLPAAQRDRRRRVNDTAAPVPDGLLTDAFRRQVDRAPGAPAVITAHGTVSYGELSRRARHAALWLRARGVGRDELVGLVMARGPEQIVGILAALLAGGAYLPVDAGLPAERQRHLLADGRVRCVLTNTGWTDPEREVLDLTGAQPAPDVGDVPALPGADPDDLAYVLHTSGSTGVPKGVMVSHRSVANVVADCNARFGIGPDDRFFAISAFTFDLSVYDVFGALSAGAAIVVPSRDEAADAAHWLELCASAGVTVWNSVPAIVSLLRDEAVGVPGALSSLRLVLMSGDRIPATLPPALRRLRDTLTLVSLGGPTETTIWNISHPIGPEEDGTRPVPYGRPNANNRAYVLDASGHEAPDWVPGEIVAAGVGLARGYWRDEALTGERFWHDERLGERLYRTGDLGRYLPSGDIDILGRADHQIKVNGYRVEAAEVELHLLAVDGVREAVVVRQSGAYGDRLVAHLTGAGDRPADATLRRELAARLPDYMVPAMYAWHEHLPITRNGKVDRARLPELAPTPATATATPAPATATPAIATLTPAAAASAPAPTPATVTATPATATLTSAAAASAPARTPTAASGTEAVVAELWASVLAVADVCATDDFFALGGDSLAAARIVTGVRKRYQVTIPLHRLPEVVTVRAMAAYIDSALARTR